MKSTVFLQFFLAFSLLSSIVSAQESDIKQRKFTYGVEVANMLVVTEPYKSFSKTGTFVKLNFGYNYSPNMYFGLSAGLNTYKNNNTMATLPVELEVKGSLFDKPVTPIAYIKGGYSFERPNDGNYGFVYSSGIGYRLKMGSRARFTPIVGYNYQQVHTYVLHTDENGYYIAKEKADPINSIYFAVRFEF
jgi:hypothetical protein